MSVGTWRRRGPTRGGDTASTASTSRRATCRLITGAPIPTPARPHARTRVRRCSRRPGRASCSARRRRWRCLPRTRETRRLGRFLSTFPRPSALRSRRSATTSRPTLARSSGAATSRSCGPGSRTCAASRRDSADRAARCGTSAARPCSRTCSPGGRQKSSRARSARCSRSCAVAAVAQTATQPSSSWRGCGA